MAPSNSAVAPSWEAQKENAAPLQRGRNVALLGLRQSDKDKQDLEKKIRHYEKLVRQSEDQNITEMDNDPLADWLSYIKFYQHSFPSDTRENFLIIERCVRALAKMKQYSNDDRFVSVCAKYADKTKDPGQVFRYLHQQKIGGRTALFWIAWAFVAEKEDDFPFAEQIFKKGISKNAEPLQMLKLRHHQFQRRMSRYWLNSSKSKDQLNDEYDTGGQTRSSRSTLGGISSDQLHCNDRSLNRIRQGNSHNYPARRQRSGRPLGTNQNNRSINQKGAFSIYVEEEGENAYNLDQEYGENDRATIAPEADRRKENTLIAERWNERGGMQHTHQRSKVSAPRNKSPFPAFSVFIDEDCAAENERLERQQKANTDLQKQVRDERTFRERDGEGMAEKIFRDPVRFLKDPICRKSEDLSERRRIEDAKAKKAKHQSKNRPGFSKRLLKNADGEEQCFEEARASAGAYKQLVDSSNFNYLELSIKQDKSSNMDVDGEGESQMDMSMSESVLDKSQYEFETSGKKLFHTLDGSFDAELNQSNFSKSSFTRNGVSIIHADLSGKQQEETINTKFAMRELSMMFSSPALEMDFAHRRCDQSKTPRIDESVAYATKADASFVTVGDGLLLDNSICNTTNEKLYDEQIPSTENTSSKAFCDGNERRRNSNAGFVVFQDDEFQSGAKHQKIARPGAVFGDLPKQVAEESPGKKLKSSMGFQIFDEGNEENNPKNVQEKLESGDTASIADAIALLDVNVETNKSTNSSSSTESSHYETNRGDETANFTLFNQIFQESNIKEDETNISTGSDSENRCSPGEELSKRKSNNSSKKSKIATTINAQKRLKTVHDEVKKTTFDYNACIFQNTEIALRDLQGKSAIIDVHTPLISSLVLKEKVYYFPSLSLPKQFRRKRLVSNTKVSFGELGGLFFKKELGRGTFGRVILIDPIGTNERAKVAIKVQSPIGSLAWEFIMLQRLKERLSLLWKKADDYAFPRPINFVSLADGGILSMSVISETGFNLVDLSNFYTFKLGKPAPELIAFHYTSVVLRIIEQLHCHANMLHCDVKPDNFVLSNSNSSNSNFSNIKYSNLTLVDFGNSVDLTQNLNFRAESIENASFYGTTAKMDMQCVAMRSGRSWSYDADTFGIICCAHVLLYGKHLEIKRVRGNRWAPLTSLKRYWKQDLWNEIFDTLLNGNECSGFTLDSHRSSLRVLRQKIDQHLKIKADALCQMLSRQANTLPNSREKIR